MMKCFNTECGKNVAGRGMYCSKLCNVRHNQERRATKFFDDFNKNPSKFINRLLNFRKQDNWHFRTLIRHRKRKLRGYIKLYSSKIELNIVFAQRYSDKGIDDLHMMAKGMRDDIMKTLKNYDVKFIDVNGMEIKC